MLFRFGLPKSAKAKGNTVGSPREMTKHQKQIIIGSVLGDAYIQKTGAQNARIRFEHSDKQKEYIFWKYEKLKKYMQDKPKLIKRFNPVYKKEYLYYRCQSHSSPIFGELRKKFYKENKKIIPIDIGAVLDNPLTLAVWFMDDGYYYHRDKIAYIYLPNIDDKSLLLLIKAFQKNFNILPFLKAKKRGKNLTFPVAETKKLVKLIEPYIISSMKYKMPENLL